MTAIKSYTDLEQSKKLAEILPLGSADMHYWKRTWKENDYAINVGHSKKTQEGFETKGIEYLPCWSLAALIAFLKNQDSCMSIKISNKDVTAFYYKYNSWKEITIKEEEAVDACVKLIIKLKKNEII